MGIIIFILLILFISYLLLPSTKQKTVSKKFSNNNEPKAQQVMLTPMRSKMENPGQQVSSYHPEPTGKVITVDVNTIKTSKLTSELMDSISIRVEGQPDTLVKDESIIDITGEEQTIPTDNNLSDTVPFWPHQYVYSFDAIYAASDSQKAFYQKFRQCFLQGQYLDVQGNSNYYFVLLFDLLNQSEDQPTLEILEAQLKQLAVHYPKTAPYCNSFLMKKMQQRNDYSGMNRMILQNPFQNSFPDYSFERLGTKFKTKLSLSEEEEKLINRIYDPSNNFSGIEFCLLQTIKLFLHLVQELDVFFKARHSGFENEFLVAAEKLAKTKFNYHSNSNLFKFALDNASSDLYSMLFKHCENALREHYGHKRKINTENYYSPQVKKIFEERIISHLPIVLPSLLLKLPLPDENTEVELNSQNTTRWKLAFEKLTDNFSKDNTQLFVDGILQLGELNKKNPSVENIFFEASKFMAKWDREASLKLYIHYLYYDLKSSTFDNKQFSKTVQKSLFKSAGELHEFEKIVTALIKNKNLEQALTSLQAVYTPKRKKIQLDATVISQVRKKHSSTVDLLDEILNDSEEEEKASITKAASNNEEYKIEIIHKQKDEEEPSVNGFSSVQAQLLQIFYKNSFQVPQSEIETFARNHGVFKSGLIDNLNEFCYEQIDDVLIEEDDYNYIMNPDYYTIIINK